MCYLATNTPHGPFWPKEEDRKRLSEVLAQSKFDHLDNNLKKRLALYLGMILQYRLEHGQAFMKFLGKMRI
ncbi:MAG: hypothetical protein CM15mP130_0940 [Verrucomicrobiota bacterium]|nr:MAG: hypothetical protein CM15mP130_0940 [Verrucomicrobiota bacterium]